VNGEWTVADDEVGLRLDKFLAAAERLASRGRAASALEKGKVLLNGADAGLRHAAYLLKEGDIVRIWMDRPGSSKPRLEAFDRGDLRILFEDDHLLVLNKPAGVLSVPLERKSEATSVYHQIEDHLRSHGKRRPFVVHRIDRDTSGLVVFAKHPRAQEALKSQFRRREPERIYRAVVYGHPNPAEGTWQDHLVWDKIALIQKKTSPRDPNGKEAVSRYRTVEAFGNASLIEVQLHTGKRNQIRIQARERGHTLVGESRYTFGPDHLRSIPFPRQALHAWRLAFLHPQDGREMRFEAPLPADMTDLITRLRRT
jgi:23S rRNA pseudouridine1911/1915/1917 synthase